MIFYIYDFQCPDYCLRYGRCLTEASTREYKKSSSVLRSMWYMVVTSQMFVVLHSCNFKPNCSKLVGMCSLVWMLHLYFYVTPRKSRWSLYFVSLQYVQSFFTIRYPIILNGAYGGAVGGICILTSLVPDCKIFWYGWYLEVRIWYMGVQVSALKWRWP